MVDGGQERMATKYKQYIVYLKDTGTNKVTRHRVKAKDRDLAARTFSDRGLHTLRAEDFWFHVTKRAAYVAVALLGLWGVVYLSIDMIQDTMFYFF